MIQQRDPAAHFHSEGMGYCPARTLDRYRVLEVRSQVPPSQQCPPARLKKLHELEIYMLPRLSAQNLAPRLAQVARLSQEKHSRAARHVLPNAASQRQG